MIKIAKGLYIHFSVFILFLVAAFSGTFHITAMAFITAVCHELCHLLASLLLKEKCHGIAVMPYGCRMFMNTVKSPVKEFFIASAGPFFNILMVLIMRKGPLYEINLAMALINLFPVMPLDGGRMLSSLIAFFTGSFRALSIMKIISLSGGIALTLLGIFQAIATGFNLSVFTAGAFLLFSAITDRGRESFYASVLEDYDKLEDGCSKTLILATRESLQARRILPLIPPTKYALIKVIGNDGKVKSEITEEELKREIIEKGAGIRLREIT